MHKKLCKKEPEEATLSIFEGAKIMAKRSECGCVCVGERRRQLIIFLRAFSCFPTYTPSPQTELAILSTENTPLIFQAL
jgi:hypothetical protein